MSRATLPIPHEKTSQVILLYSISLPPELPLGMISLDTTDLPTHYLTQNHLHSVAPRIFKICLPSILEPSIYLPSIPVSASNFRILSTKKRHHPPHPMHGA
jgi:hypothetical protein